MEKAFYLIEAGRVISWHEKLHDAQRAMLEALQSGKYGEIYLCEVLPRESARWEQLA